MKSAIELPPVAILSGGLATRLRPLTQDIPKALLDVGGEPFIAHQLRLLRGAGVRRVVLCVGYLGEEIRAYVGDGQRFDIDVDYAFDGSRLLGTAGALRCALYLLGEHFFALYGDSYLQCDYAAVNRAFLSSHKPALMTVYRNDNAYDRSNVELNNGAIVAYDKRTHSPRMRHIDYGLSVLSARALSTIVEGDHADLPSVYQSLVGRGRLAAYEVQERFYEIGSFDGLEELRALVLQRRNEGLCDVPERDHLTSPHITSTS